MQSFYSKLSCLSGAIFFFLGCAVEMSAATPAKSTAKPIAQLSTGQRSALKKLGIPIAVPAYVPTDFRLSRVVANACPKGGSATGSCREGSNYTIVYRNPRNTCLLVHAIGGGIGGGAAEFEYETETPLLGKVMILFGDRSRAGQPAPLEQLRIPQKHLSSFPASIKSRKTPYYSVVVGDSTYYQETYGCGKNTSVTPIELEKIVQSLQLLE